MADRIGKPISQRQLRGGEMIKQSLSMIFIRNEAKVPNLETNTITVTEVRMSQDLKIAKAYVLPLGGKNAEETVNTFSGSIGNPVRIRSATWSLTATTTSALRIDLGIAQDK